MYSPREPTYTFRRYCTCSKAPPVY